MSGSPFSLFLSFLALCVITAAQLTSVAPVAPVPASGSAYAKYRNKFYVYGGHTRLDVEDITSTSGQFFALDLSISWKSESPVWIRLPEGPRKDYIGAVVSADGKTFMSFPGIGYIAHRFFFENNTWSPSKVNFRESMYDVQPVTLGTDDSVLIVGGFEDHEYDVYSLETDQTVTLSLPQADADGSPYLPGRRDYRALWSEHLKSAVFFGGFGTNLPSAEMVSLYHPESEQWKGMKTTGFGSKSLIRHCVAITDDGKTILSFGGTNELDDAKASSSLFILDLATGTWTEAANLNSPRANAACTVAGDYFLLWGGGSKVEGPDSIFDLGKSSTPVFIYQISTNSWVNKFQPPADYLEPTPESPSKPQSNIGVLAVAAVSVVILMSVVGFLVWKRRRQSSKRLRHRDCPSPQGVDADTSLSGTSGALTDEQADLKSILDVKSDSLADAQADLSSILDGKNDGRADLQDDSSSILDDNTDDHTRDQAGRNSALDGNSEEYADDLAELNPTLDDDSDDRTCGHSKASSKPDLTSIVTE